MTLEEKAKDYANNYTKSDIGMGEKFRTAKHFIAGYNMRGLEIMQVIEAMEDMVKHYKKHGQLLTWNVGIAILALEDLTNNTKKI